MLHPDEAKAVDGRVLREGHPGLSPRWRPACLSSALYRRLAGVVHHPQFLLIPVLRLHHVLRAVDKNNHVNGCSIRRLSRAPRAPFTSVATSLRCSSRYQQGRRGGFVSLLPKASLSTKTMLCIVMSSSRRVFVEVILCTLRYVTLTVRAARVQLLKTAR